MAWASNRKTTREEDIAYCLLGIFDISMLPMYGEGQEHAFYRFQEEINKRLKISECHQTAMSEASRVALTTWLQLVSVGEDFQELLYRRYAGTCHWIFDKTE